ncbi:universal stress protein [candidate division KSB1 bacterium]|nr:universal stress protein [candidate division KSB1 bacterium]
MLQISNILCPTDFSDFSLQALKFASDLAQIFSAKLYIVNVVTPLPVLETPVNVGFDPNRFQKEMQIHAQKTIKNFSKKFVHPDVTTETIVAIGSEVDEILNVGKEKQVDLLVLATHGKSGIERLFFGSVAEKIIRHSTFPVLTIRPQKKKK